MKRKFCVLQILFFSAFLFGQERTLEELFPGTKEAVLNSARNGTYSRSLKTAANIDIDAYLAIKPLAEINLTRRLMDAEPLYIIESLLMIKNDKPAGKLDVYNALRKISTLRGRKYFSSTRGKETVMFEDAAIITGENNFKKQKDPPYAESIPSVETIFVTVKDVNFGNCYYKAEIKTDNTGIWYSLSNFRSINYLMIPVIKPEKLLIQLYLEPLKDGVLIYGLSGVDAVDFAEKRVDIPSTITKRLDVIYSWIGESISECISN
jgi:hypothetical protein